MDGENERMTGSMSCVHGYYGRRFGNCLITTPSISGHSKALSFILICITLGIVRAPVFTTAMQVASRVILVWAIVDQFPAATSKSLAYSTMLLAWSATEVVRYSYFVFNLNGSVPGFLTWLRYNGFFLLYPMGISSEMFLVYMSIKPASKRDPRLGYGLWAILGLYVPGMSFTQYCARISCFRNFDQILLSSTDSRFTGAYILYTHMMTQRRRVMRGKAKAK